MDNTTIKHWPNVGHCARNFVFTILSYLPSNLTRANTSPRLSEAAYLVDSVWFSPWCSIRFFWRRHPQIPTVELNFISLFWPSLPTGIQAAYEDIDSDLVFLFKGKCLGFSSHFHSAWREGKDFFVILTRFRGDEPIRECYAGLAFV